MVILGNGPSLSEIPIDKLTAHPRVDLMSVNHPDARVWPTKYWAFCDMSQYRRHQEHWRTYGGTVITSAAVGNSKELTGDRPGVVYVRNLGGYNFSRDLIHGCYVGRSTVYANMQTALWMGYDKVYILGCDMGAAADGRMWYYGVNPDVPPDDRAKRFELDAKHYEYAADTLPAADRAKFAFCSSYNKWPFVDKFSRMDHEIAIDAILRAETR